MTTKTKVCSSCGHTKPQSEFAPRRDDRSKTVPQCKTCDNARSLRTYYNNKKREQARNRKWTENNPARRRELKRMSYHRNSQSVLARRRMSCYGVSQKQYDELFARQHGLCCICGDPEISTAGGKIKAMAVDHCHDTGRVRGLLCCRCNVGLGMFRDSPSLLRVAASYVVRHAEFTE